MSLTYFGQLIGYVIGISLVCMIYYFVARAVWRTVRFLFGVE